MITYIIIKMHCKPPSQNIGFTRRLYSVHTGRLPRAHGTLEDLIVLHDLFERGGNAVSTCTPLWCDRGLSFIRI